jgi:NPCBM/NEW2 domain
MDVKMRDTTVKGLSICAGLLVLFLLGIRIISFIERQAKNQPAEPIKIKVFPPLEGRWENDRGYIVFQKEDRSIKGRYISHNMERVVDGVKETALVTGLNTDAWLNKFENEELVFIKKARWKHDYQTLTFWDENGREFVYRRKEVGPNGEKVEAPPIDPTWDEGKMTPVYLSDMPEINPSVGYGVFGKNGQLGYGVAGAKSSPITVAGRMYPRAISLAPPHSGHSAVQYSLGRDGKIFHAQVAVNDLDDAKREGPETPLQFLVLGDGRYIWTSEKVRLAGVTQECRINVAGVKVLELQVHCPGPMNCARAVWLEPRVLK